MKKKIIISIIILFVVGISYKVGFSLGKERDLVYKELDIFAESLAIIESKYVETKSAKDVIYGAMGGMLSSLDAYSQFLNPEDYQDLIVETEGQFGGLGIEITIKDNLLTVISPIEDTPAWKAGMASGDIIVKIDGVVTKDITLAAAVKKMRGAPGTKVVLTVLGEKDKKIKEVTIIRDIIKIKDIKRAITLEDGIGYIRISEFREKTAVDLDKSLGELKKAGLKGLIIDVRNNPGGLLLSAVDVASRFLEDGKVIVSTKSRSEKEEIYKTSPGGDKILTIPIVILINKGSASGSEILAAALRDNKRAVLLGETTFGKASVQTIIPLSDGSALRLTTSRYYTPNGVSIHEKGVVPDIAVAVESTNETKEKEDVFKDLENLEKVIPVKDNIEKEKEFDYKKDNQIMRALDLIKGLLVISVK